MTITHRGLEIHDVRKKVSGAVSYFKIVESEMKVRCNYQIGEPIPDEVLALGNTPESEFPLTRGREYVVYGMLLCGGMLHYLVIGDGLRWPHWFPACFFSVANARLPSTWRFSTERDHTKVRGSAIWGYPELVASDGKHSFGLVEREPEALLVFEEVRKELEAEDARAASEGRT
jgi:hypothetical protein